MEKNLIDIIAKSGIVGAGGAGFPTHVKMNAKAEYVIISLRPHSDIIFCNYPQYHSPYERHHLHTAYIPHLQIRPS